MKSLDNGMAPSLQGRRSDPDIAKFVATIRTRFQFSEADVDMLQSRMTQIATFEREQAMVLEGERIHYSSLILDGYAARAKLNHDGTRQIAQLQIPGDFVDLHSYPLEALDHSIIALTPCRIVKLAHRDIDEIIAASPRMARVLWFSTMVDAAMHREWIQNIGSRQGLSRIAHLMSELYTRSKVVGLASGKTFAFPLTQAQLGECLGFSQMHINRLLKQLRDEGYLTVKKKVATIQDEKGLYRLADFDPAYLYLEPRTS